ncbi:efflux transporter outer membrane subunit [Sphingomonas immobilis]|uniref:Efflux transporter outer membrane subunit n=1 Tax=Sphingomonas immobilis TaxID=3063997 RepID=A0ABT9A3J1_9SPHN|nr:efflux transporter outer membrane subunit [Sphingomonas sp. CA1-15]MDO7844406.1 efflux transporter outer membrane subunit [Sphingomonas sp. CA1-15]
MRHVAPLIALALLGGCTMAPKYVRSATPVPPAWPAGDAYAKADTAPLPAIGYRDIFRDARLQRIVEQALVNNRDLRVAAANIAAARAAYRIQHADLFPTIDAAASDTYRKNSGAGVNNNGGAAGSIANTTSVSVGTTAWEIDLFGRIRSLNDAALNRYFGTEAGAAATRLTLVGDIATAWLTYASDKSLLAIAEQTAANAKQSVTLTGRRLSGGIAPRTDLDQAQIVLRTAESDLAQQKTALAQDVNALQLLVGAPVDAALLPASIEEAGKSVAELPAGLDSRVLLRRPDVLQAEYELRATNAEIGAARAALFPTISLTALAGFSSTALSNLFTGGAFNYSVAPSVNYPIFRAGAGRAGVRQSEAQRDAALATYEKAIQTAFREVSDALARRGTIADQLKAQADLVASSSDNYKLSDARYKGGIDSFLQSLTAQQSLYSARRTQVATQLAAETNLVTLYRTLGGDASLDVAPGDTRPVPTSQ